MHKAKRERLYRNVYRVLAGVLALSAILLFVMNIMPFGFGASWSGQSLVVTYSRALSNVGNVVAKSGALTGQAELLTVTSIARQDGELYYSVAERSEPIKAREASNEVLATVPVLGYWARALSHPVGVLALIGIPLFTFALDIVAVAWAGNVHANLTRRVAAMKKRRAVRKQNKERERLQYEEEVEQELYTPPRIPEHREVLTSHGTHHAPVAHGMTIRLTRPQRYSMTLR